MKKNRAHIRREPLPDVKAPQSKDGFVFSDNINDWMFSNKSFARDRRSKQPTK